MVKAMKREAAVPFVGYDMEWERTTLKAHKHKIEELSVRRNLMSDLDSREQYLKSSMERNKSFEYAKQLYKEKDVLQKFLKSSWQYFEAEVECLELFCWIWILRMEHKVSVDIAEEDIFRRYMSKHDRICEVHYWVAFELCQASARFYKHYLPKVSKKFANGEYNKREVVVRLKPFLQWMKGNKRSRVEAFFNKHRLLTD